MAEKYINLDLRGLIRIVIHTLYNIVAEWSVCINKESNYYFLIGHPFFSELI